MYGVKDAGGLKLKKDKNKRAGAAKKDDKKKDVKGNFSLTTKLFFLDFTFTWIFICTLTTLTDCVSLNDIIIIIIIIMLY